MRFLERPDIAERLELYRPLRIVPPRHFGEMHRHEHWALVDHSPPNSAFLPFKDPKDEQGRSETWKLEFVYFKFIRRTFLHNLIIHISRRPAQQRQTQNM